MKFLSALKAERCVTQLLAEPGANTPVAQKALQNLKNSGPGAIPILIDALAGADRHQTIGIVDALTAQINDQTFKAIAQGLRHVNERCVAGVAWALSSSQDYTADKLTQILTIDDIAKHAVLDTMRSHLDRLSIHLLLKTAYQLEPREKSAVFKMVGEKATEELVPDLISRLGGHDHSARVHLVGILSQFTLPEVVHALEGLLSDGNRQVRGAALEALGEMQANHNIELICSLLMDPDLDVQSKAVELVIKLRHPDTVKHLVGVLQDESEYTRRSAVEVLNEIAEPASIKYLLVAIGDGDWWVRSRACDALANIGGPKVLQAVMELIGDDDENIRRSAIEILNQTKDEAAVKHLIEATRDEDWWVSERAVDALAEIGSNEAVPRLIEMLDSNPKAIPSVVRALGKLGDSQVVPKLLGIFQRPEPDIIVAAVTALSQLVNDSNVEQIRTQIQPLLSVSNENIVTAARDALEKIENRYSESAIEAKEKAERMAEPAHTMLIDESDMKKMARQMAPATSEQIDLSALKTGDLIENRYSYIEKIGKGAFGTVILVEDTVVEERLILKFLNANFATDDKMLKRFVHELRFSRKITHKNVIRIYDFLHLSGSYAISMEYFPSHTLGAEVAGNIALPIDKAAGWAQDVATGMEVAHQVGVIHRDLKPANLLIDDEGLLKIVDFGVAAAQGGGDTQLTKTGYVIGSPKYMAPEQILGKKVDYRSDIYSLGVIFYEMLTGSPPYTKGDHMAVMYQHVQGKCPRCDELNPNIPTKLANVVHKAMEIDKAKRYETMDDMRKAIIKAC
ncbi:MAG: HEAT repeat domain-containing protein [Gammaproteobacteria bacterium]|nr:HEAT repeat domain-containing protein [Gammaproteobacteria bacterium]MDP6617007.1 HEAT repeat domain-containing protein [Gammaproteobacteria bacterium]MDP6695101.1 HEAT repeat domain-containing protein [Gammaproteobacteria bacterium]